MLIPRSPSSVKCLVAAGPALSPRLLSGYRDHLSIVGDTRSDASQNTICRIELVDNLDWKTGDLKDFRF